MENTEKTVIKNDIIRKKDIVIPKLLPLLPLRDIVVLPEMIIPLAVGRAKSINAVSEAMTRNRLIFITSQKKATVEGPSRQDLYDVGSVAEILQMLRMPDNTIKILVESITRARMLEYNENEKYVEVEIAEFSVTARRTQEITALMRNATSLFDEYVKLNKRLPVDLNLSVSTIDDPGRLSDVIASHIMTKMEQKQLLLETIEPKDRLVELAKILNQEIEILTIESRIQNRVRKQIEKSQKEYYLNEQMKAIQKELRQKDDFGREIDELRKKIKDAKMPKEAEDAANTELARLEKMAPFSPEGTVIRTYIDWLVNLPWSVRTEDTLDIGKAEQILDEDHYGLAKAKERITEYLSVCKLASKLKGPILCFVGPPGVGKTSLGKSVARALGRKFARISLGGIRDEAEIRGHRRTYIGSLPGRIIQSLRKCKSRNPVFLLDEIDKMGMDFRGDPASAMLEVLDPEQNSTYTDHYLDLEFDLSDVFFITTANNAYAIPPTLMDRMEIIQFPGYTPYEKEKIAEKYLIPKQTKENGLTEDNIEITKEALKAVIENYTRESGVRNLEREIANIMRKCAKKFAKENKKEKIKIIPEELNKYLGVQKYSRDKNGHNEIGIMTGLAWTEVGGEVLFIETTIMKGKGKLILTGKLGEVMRESATAALSYIRANAKKIGLKQKGDFFNGMEIHIHIPEGAVPKDGPSAGITMAASMLSALMQRPPRPETAMTGEITLRGRVLPIGGLKEKLLAAQRSGIKTVIFPKENVKDLEDIQAEIKDTIKLIPVEHMDEVIKIVFARGNKSKK